MPHALRVSAMAAALVSGTLLASAATALATYPGSNGRIAFAYDPGPATYDIFTMNPDGSDQLQLTNDPANDTRPSYSADGERIAFVRDPVAATNSQIWVMNADGSDQTQLTTGVTADTEPMFSPDGSRILFQSGTSPGSTQQIFVMDADGSNRSQITFPGPDNSTSQHPSYSPDGSQIAFTRRTTPGGPLEIWIMNADGSGQTKLTTGDANNQDLGPSFSPDGRRIAFDHFTPGPPNEDLFVMDPDGTNPAQVTSGGGQDYFPEFSPDGTRILFERETQGFTHSNIMLTDPNGLDLGTTPITENAAPVYSSNPAWQPLNAPVCDLTGSAKQKSVKSVTVNVGCDENATVVAEGSGQAPKPKGSAGVSKKKKFTIPAVTSQVEPGTPTAVTLAIPKKGRKALKKAAKAGKKGKATITATITDDLGQATTDTFDLTFKPKKK